MVVETSRPITDVARELGINETSLGNWVRAYREKHADDEPPWNCPSGRACVNLSAVTVSWRWRTLS